MYVCVVHVHHVYDISFLARDFQKYCPLHVYNMRGACEYTTLNNTCDYNIKNTTCGNRSINSLSFHFNFFFIILTAQGHFFAAAAALHFLQRFVFLNVASQLLLVSYLLS